MSSFPFRRAIAASALLLVVCAGAAGTAGARSAQVKGARILDAEGHEMKVRGVTWGGSRFVAPDAATPLPAPDVTTASRDFRRIARMGANLVRIDVSSAADDDAHRLAFQRLQRLAKARGLQILFANVALNGEDQRPWLQTLAGWFPRTPNVWYLPEVDPYCALATIGDACGDTEAWIVSQRSYVDALRAAGVRTPIVVNLPSGSQSASRDLATALGGRNIVFGVHPASAGRARFSDQDGRALTTSLQGAAEQVPVLFDDIARIEATIDLARSGPDQGGRLADRATATTTDSLRWSQGLLEWVTGWTLGDGGDGAIVDGFGTDTPDEIAKGRRQFTTWGQTAAAGYFAITYRAQAGRDPGTGFPGGFEYGDAGAGVRALQEDLAARGYLGRGDVTGEFDDATWQGVVAFQGYQRLERTGVAGAATLALIRRAEPPIARHPDRGRHIEIDISRGIVLLVEADGRVRRVIHTSTGAEDNTPDGEFTIIRRERMSWNYKYKLWMPYAQYFFEGFALHEYPDVPAYPASHGCGRLHAANAPAVWAFGEMGMPVILYH